MQTTIKIGDLKRAEYNPRFMPDNEMQALKKSIESFGFVEPVVINISTKRYGILIGGHQRITALDQLLAVGILPANITMEPGHLMSDPGVIYLVPAIGVDLDEEKEKILNLSLNKITGRWDENKLFNLILSINDHPLLPASGFDAKDIAAILDQNEGNSKVTEVHGFKHECGRCTELKLQVMGHGKRSGHPIRFEENADPKN